MTFEGLRVLEYGPQLSAQYAAKLFADMGAEVIKIEYPNSGDWTRGRGPYQQDRPDPEGSGLFLYLNTNKLGITLDLGYAEGRRIFSELVQRCDLLIDGNPPDVLDKLGFGYDSLHDKYPQLVMMAVTPFGQDGPYRDYKAYPLNLFHAGGEGYLLPGGLAHDRNPEGGPIKAPGYVGDFDGGVAAATAAAAALVGRAVTNEGCYIDVSVQEALLQLSRVEIERYADEGKLDNRGTRNLPGGFGMQECADGWALVQPTNDQMWSALVSLMGSPEWAKEPEFADGESRVRNAALVRAHLSEWAKGHSKHWIYHEGQQAGVITGAVFDARDLFESSQTQAREFFVTLDHGYAGPLQYPAIPYKFSESAIHFRSAAPMLGQHNRHVYSDLLGHTEAELGALKAANVI